MKYHAIAFFGGFILDLLLGDPPFLPHPVRLIGKLITVMEKKLRSKLPPQKGIETGEEVWRGALIGACRLRYCRSHCGAFYGWHTVSIRMSAHSQNA